MSIHKIIPEVVLASKSNPRRELLEKLHIKFNVLPADIDETALLHEQPKDLVERLSRKKAEVVLDKLLISDANKDYVIISSDQVAVVNNKVYGKPGNHENAIKQLNTFSGQKLEFITGLCVLIPSYLKNDSLGIEDYESIYTHEISTIKIKELNNIQIENYLNKEQPYNCAASFKIEGLGISLVESIKTEDFNAIIGLPLIKLTNILTKINLDVLSI